MKDSCNGVMALQCSLEALQMHCDLVMECDLTHNYVSSCMRVLYVCIGIPRGAIEAL